MFWNSNLTAAAIFNKYAPRSTRTYCLLPKLPPRYFHAKVVCLSSSSSSISTSQSYNDYAKKWKYAVNNIIENSSDAKELLLPNTTRKQEQAYYAYFGDKILETSFVLAMKYHPELQYNNNTNNEVSLQTLSRIRNVGVSNTFLRKHKDILLPESMQHLYADEYTDHKIGTCIEVAINFVHEQQHYDAINEVAQWLLQQCLILYKTKGTMDGFLDELNDYNENDNNDNNNIIDDDDDDYYDVYGSKLRDYKSTILEFGGSIESKRIGGSDHDPIFQATVTVYNDHFVHDDYYVTSAKGNRKLIAEQKACKQAYSYLVSTIMK